MAGGQILAFPIDIDRRPYNTFALPCECVILPNFIEIEETFCGWTDGRTDRHLRPTLLGRLRGVDLIIIIITIVIQSAAHFVNVA